MILVWRRKPKPKLTWRVPTTNYLVETPEDASQIVASMVPVITYSDDIADYDPGDLLALFQSS